MKTQTKHTPGPWEHSDDGSIVVTTSCDGISNVLETYDWMGEEERLANARLIASCPDMYKLLCDIRDWVEADGESFQYYEEINQVLSKAEGGEK